MPFVLSCEHWNKLHIIKMTADQFGKCLSSNEDFNASVERDRDSFVSYWLFLKNSIFVCYSKNVIGCTDRWNTPWKWAGSKTFKTEDEAKEYSGIPRENERGFFMKKKKISVNFSGDIS